MLPLKPKSPYEARNAAEKINTLRIRIVSKDPKVNIVFNPPRIGSVKKLAWSRKTWGNTWIRSHAMSSARPLGPLSDDRTN